MTTIENKLFGKYDYNIVITDPSMKQYISFGVFPTVHSFARHANKAFAKTKVNIVERLANKLMRGGTGEKTGGKIIRTHGKLQGKKSRVIGIIKQAFEIVEKRTNKNPIQVLVEAIQNSAPREDITRVKFGGMSYQTAVDVSPSRRLDMALRNLSLAAIISSFDEKATLADCLANELVLASQGSVDSYSVKRRNEIERIARSAR